MNAYATSLPSGAYLSTLPSGRMTIENPPIRAVDLSSSSSFSMQKSQIESSGVCPRHRVVL